MNKCLGVVLAGGLSSRMGQDKSQLSRNDISMLQYSKQLLTDCNVDDIVISGNNHQVSDLYTNAGPLGGIYSVIKQRQPQSLLILPVDLPLMTSETLNQLKMAGELKQQACYFNEHYLPLYLPVNAYSELFFEQAFKHFDGKGPSIRALLKQIPHQVLTPANTQTLFNSNTPEQWQQAKTIFKRSSYV